MNKVLSEANKILHKSIKTTNTPFYIRKRGNLLHVCVGSTGCRFSSTGSCTMCNYGTGRTVCENDIQDMIESIKMYSSEIDSILVGSNGSVFDTLEIPNDIFDTILENLCDIDIDVIIFETHYTTVNDQILKKISSKLAGKDIVIEMGLESSDEFVRNQCLNKSINLDIFIDKINLIHNYKMSVSANVFFGAPFLSSEEQISDTLQTIKWSIDNGINNIVVFPANIRDNTLLSYLYKNGRYTPLSGWALVELLNRVPEKFQDRIYLSWFGDWDDEKILVKPKSCDVCRSTLDEFFNIYLSIKRSDRRKELVNKFIRTVTPCDCYAEFMKSLQTIYNDSKASRVEAQQKWLVHQLNIKF